MSPPRVINPDAQPDAHVDRRHGVVSRRALAQGQTANQRRALPPGIAIGNGSVVQTDAIKLLHVRGSGASLSVTGDVATLTIWPSVLVKAGAPADSDFTALGLPTPPNGTLALDSTNSRLYVRVGGTWKYAALT